ncbi:hypothetical protein EBR96_03110 [bacterium]|nr:hypothetical protein [bacterium]
MTIKTFASVTATAILLMGSIHAAEKNLAFSNPRLMGMGGAGVAVATDESTLYLNPAGLARAAGPKIKGPRLRIELGSEYTSSIDKVLKLKDTTDTKLVSNLIGLDGSTNLAGQIASFTTKGFGIGAFVGSDIYSSIRHDASLSLHGLTDAGIAVGLAREFTIFGQSFDVGVSAKGIARSIIYNPSTGENQVTLTDAQLLEVINTSNTSAKEKYAKTFSATGVGFDLGILTNITGPTIPTLTVGASVRNIGSNLTGTRTVSGNVENVTVTLPMTTTIGLATTTKLPVVGDVNLAADYTLSPADTFYTGLHLGVEKKIGEILSLRGGINQGYVVGGFGLDIMIVKFDYTFFAKEQGRYAGDTPDVYHSIQLGILL